MVPFGRTQSRWDCRSAVANSSRFVLPENFRKVLTEIELATKRRVRARGLQSGKCAPVGRVPSRGGPWREISGLMLGRFLLCFLLLLAATISRAADYDAQFNKWFEVQTNLQSWSADFTQTRSLKVLTQPLITTGKVWVKRGEFRWELGQPVQTVVLRRPDELFIIYPRLKRAEKYPLDAVPSGPMKDALALLDASLPRDRASMEEHFRLLSAAQTAR